MFRRRTTSPAPSSAASGGGLSLRAAEEVDASESAAAALGAANHPASSSSPVLIQRLIILHDGLMPLPPSKSKVSQQQQQQQQRASSRIKQRRNPQAALSENASLEEHGEFILYYYDHSLHHHHHLSHEEEGSSSRRPQPVIPLRDRFRRQGSNESVVTSKSAGGNSSARSITSNKSSSTRSLRGENSTTKPPADYATEEAVRFAGICRALRSLPGALQPETTTTADHTNRYNEDEDLLLSEETNVVHLSDSTLVFVPLELHGDIICIAQIPRASAADNHSSRQQQQNRSSSQHWGYGANPSAVNQAIHDIHTSFSLLFGGGIHQRLLRTKHLEKSKDWVLEVIEDTTTTTTLGREDATSSFLTANNNNNRDKLIMSSKSPSLKRKDDATWEMGVPSETDDNDHDANDEHEHHPASVVLELVEQASISSTSNNKKESRRKPSSRRSGKRRLTKLSASFSLDGSINSSFNSRGGEDTTYGISGSNDHHHHQQQQMLKTFNNNNNNNNNSHLEGGNTNNVGDYRYGGMEELFNLRREHRKLSNELREDNNTTSSSYSYTSSAPQAQGARGSAGHRFGGLGTNSRWGSSSNAQDLFNDIANDVGHNDCERRIENLLTLLPITRLREDLVTYYDEWLYRRQGVCDVMQGGVGRCIVELIPFPIRSSSSSSLARKEAAAVRGQHPPLSPNAFVCLAGAEFMKSMMYDQVPKLLMGGTTGRSSSSSSSRSGDLYGRLSGMSMFHQNRLVLSEMKINPWDNNGAMPPEISYSIVEYFHTRRKKQMEEDDAAAIIAQNEIAAQQRQQAKIDQNSNERQMPRWMSSLSLTGASAKSSLDNGMGEDNAAATTSGGNDKKAANNGGGGAANSSPSGYVAHPSSSPKDSKDAPINSLFLRSIKKHVWLQRVHLPSSCTLLGFDNNNNNNSSGSSAADDNDTATTSETHVAMFESQELSFLLYFEIPSSSSVQQHQGGEDESVLAQMSEELRAARYNNKSSRKVNNGNNSNKVISSATQAFVDMLLFLSDQLTEFFSTFSSSSHEVDDSMMSSPPDDNNIMAPVKEINSDSVFPGEPGIDIICIDRDECSFVLLSQHDLSSNEFKRIAPTKDDDTKSPSSNGSKQKFGLFGMGKPKEDASSEQGIRSSRPSQYSNMLDCRHKLAAYLSLDVMLAFDDLFNEIGSLTGSGRKKTDALSYTGGGNNTQHVDNATATTTRSIELCTFLPQGWVYGRAFGNVELYILLDTSRFVTINDVQKAVTRVRERVFNDKIR